jgi:hypothetical protein
MQQTLEIQYISLSEYIKWISRGFPIGNAG